MPNLDTRELVTQHVLNTFGTSPRSQLVSEINCILLDMSELETVGQLETANFYAEKLEYALDHFAEQEGRAVQEVGGGI